MPDYNFKFFLPLNSINAKRFKITKKEFKESFPIRNWPTKAIWLRNNMYFYYSLLSLTHLECNNCDMKQKNIYIKFFHQQKTGDFYHSPAVDYNLLV